MFLDYVVLSKIHVDPWQNRAARVSLCVNGKCLDHVQFDYQLISSDSAGSDPVGDKLG